MKKDKIDKINDFLSHIGINIICFGIGLATSFLILTSFQNKEKILPKTNKIKVGYWKELCDTMYISTAMTYYPTISQCDSTPWSTADHSKIDSIKLKNQEIKWLALSRDLIWDEERQKLYKDTTHWRGPIPFGDSIFIKSESDPQMNGYWTAHDCKGPSYKNSIDFLVDPINNKPKLGICRDIKIINTQLKKRLNL